METTTYIDCQASYFVSTKKLSAFKRNKVRGHVLAEVAEQSAASISQIQVGECRIWECLPK